MVTIRFGFNGTQQRTTCSMSGRPPAGCSTFAREDFRRVPLPAARMTIATSLFGIVRPFSPALLSLTIPGLDFCEDFPRRAGFRWYATRLELCDRRTNQIPYTFSALIQADLSSNPKAEQGRDKD